MKVVKSKRKGNTFNLEIEENHDKMNVAMDSAFKRLVRDVKAPGFRKGKLPRNLFEKYYGREGIIQEALMDVVNSAYYEAILDLNLEIVDKPKNIDITEYKENEPILFKCEVDVKPEVSLGKYKGLKAKKLPETIEESQVDEQINQVLENHAQYKETEEPGSEGDILRFNLEAAVNEEVVETLTKENTGLQLGRGYFGAKFDEEVSGLKKDDEKAFEVTYDEAFEIKEIAGKTVHFKIKVTEVRKKELPQLDDEFIKKATGVDTAEELRTKIRENLEIKAKQESADKLKMDLMDQVIDSSKMDLHEVMIEREVENSVNYFGSNLKRSGMSLDNYMKYADKTIESIKEELKPASEKRVKTALILDAISTKENITVEETDLEEEIKSWNVPNITSLEELKKNPAINIENVKAMIRDRKTYDFIIENAKIS